MKAAALTLIAFATLAGCGDGSQESSPAPAAPTEEQRSAHEQDIYDQQRGVCKTEAKFNTVEYREQKGATDPERYAEYAARHGFYLVRDDAELQAAIDGCLAGLP